MCGVEDMSRVIVEGSRVAALVRDNGVEAESCDASRAFSLALDGLPQLGTHQPVGDDAPDSLQFRSFVNSFAPSRKQPRQATKNLRVEIALGVQRLLRKAGHPKFGSINSTVRVTNHSAPTTHFYSLSTDCISPWTVSLAPGYSNHQAVVIAGGDRLVWPAAQFIRRLVVLSEE